MDNKISQHVVNEIAMVFGVPSLSGNDIAFRMALRLRSGECIAYWRNEQTEPQALVRMIRFCEKSSSMNFPLNCTHLSLEEKHWSSCQHRSDVLGTSCLHL